MSTEEKVMSPEAAAPMSAPMSVELRPLDAVRPYANNPRQNVDAVEAVAESIRRFGFRQPIVVDADGVIVAGHTRFRAAAAPRPRDRAGARAPPT
jgi:hypothetical protein